MNETKIIILSSAISILIFLVLFYLLYQKFIEDYKEKEIAFNFSLLPTNTQNNE